MKIVTFKRVLILCAILLGVLFVAMLISLKVGAVRVNITDLAMNLTRLAIGESDTLPTEYRMIILDLRLPRILMGVLVGAALAVAGASFQALLRNPLAEPYVLGVSSGAALGALVSLMVGAHVGWATPAGAFAGAGLAISAVYLLGRRSGQLDSYTLLLAGVIMASFLSAVIMFLMTTLTGGTLRGMAFWLMGDLSTSPPVPLGILFGVVAVTIGIIYTTAGDLNLLITGEQEARHLGVDVGRVKLVVYVAASLLTGIAVSISGAIGYVGLLVPHAMRMLVGSDYRVLIPTSAIGGAIAIVVADTLARTIFSPTELPVGAMTAMAGAPVFIYLLRRRMR